MESGSPCWAACGHLGAAELRGVAPADLRQVVSHRRARDDQLTRLPLEGVAGGVLLPAAAVAARAAVPVRHHLHVPELAGHAVGAAVDPAVHDDRAADAGAQRDAQDEAVAGAGAEPALAERGGVGVVVDHDRDGDPAGQAGPQRLVAPRQVRREHHGGAAGVDEACGADADRGDVVQLLQLLDQLDDGVLDPDDVVPQGGSATELDHGPARVDDPGQDLGAADVDADRQRVPQVDPGSPRGAGGGSAGTFGHDGFLPQRRARSAAPISPARLPSRALRISRTGR